jgi:hypothetical protein
VVRIVVVEQRPDHDQDGVADGDRGLLRAATWGEAVVLSREIGVFGARGGARASLSPGEVFFIPRWRPDRS